MIQKLTAMLSGELSNRPAGLHTLNYRSDVQDLHNGPFQVGLSRVNFYDLDRFG